MCRLPMDEINTKVCLTEKDVNFVVQPHREFYHLSASNFGLRRQKCTFKKPQNYFLHMLEELLHLK